MGRQSTTKTTRTRPAIYFRVPVPIHTKLKQIAAAEGVPISEAVRMVLRAALKKDVAA